MAILGLLLFGLGLSVSVMRFRERTTSARDADPTNRLHKLVRAHANTAEYAPFLALLFLYFGARSPSATTVLLIVAATACRCLLVVALACVAVDGEAEPRAVRRCVGTCATGLALCGTLLR
ncbi:MAG TPA: MAPEG family protein [Paraburkholderia sp.]|nr:MAPEG family protein [Paraburkholderia sp.]